MNDTATAGGASGASLIPSTTDAFTYAHLIVIALFAVAVLVAIVWGMRLKRQRKAAEEAIAERNVEVEQTTEEAPSAAPPVARARAGDGTISGDGARASPGIRSAARPRTGTRPLCRRTDRSECAA